MNHVDIDVAKCNNVILHCGIVARYSLNFSCKAPTTLSALINMAPACWLKRLTQPSNWRIYWHQQQAQQNQTVDATAPLVCPLHPPQAKYIRRQKLTL